MGCTISMYMHDGIRMLTPYSSVHHECKKGVVCESNTTDLYFNGSTPCYFNNQHQAYSIYTLAEMDHPQNSDIGSL